MTEEFVTHSFQEEGAYNVMEGHTGSTSVDQEAEESGGWGTMERAFTVISTGKKR